MEESMIRLLTFLIVIAGLVLYFRMTSAPRREKKPVFKTKKKSASTKQPAFGEFWVQVYDTDSADEAKKIQAKFQDMGIQCFLYEQGKKDVYGNVLKHYGISVPRQNSDRAQSILAQITL